MGQLIYSLDLIGTFVFAVSGALAAARQKMDIMGFLLVAMAAAVGGGTVRDLVLDSGAVFWAADANYFYSIALAAVFTFFWAHKVSSRFKYLVWADAFGLALFALIGTQKAMGMGLQPIICVVMGAFTATLGGILRDILCGEVPLVLRREIYVLAAVAGSLTYWGVSNFGWPGEPALLMGFVATLAVRGPAIIFGWSLPVYGRED